MTPEAPRSPTAQYGTGRLLGLTVLFCVALVALIYGDRFRFRARDYSTWFDLAGMVGMATFFCGALRSVTPLFQGRLLASVLTQLVCFAAVVATNLLARSYYSNLGFAFPTVTDWALFYPTIHYVGLRSMSIGAWGISCMLVLTACAAMLEKQLNWQQRDYNRMSHLAVGVLVAHVVAILLPIWTIIQNS